MSGVVANTAGYSPAAYAVMEYFFGAANSADLRRRGTDYEAKGLVYTNNLALRMQAVESEGAQAQLYVPHDETVRRLLTDFRWYEPELWHTALAVREQLDNANKRYLNAALNGSTAEKSAHSAQIGGLQAIDAQAMDAVFRGLEAFAGEAFTPAFALELCK
jgi:hypothetical protein